MKFSDTPIEISDQSLSESDVFVLAAFDSLIEELEQSRKNAVEFYGRDTARKFAIVINHLETAKLWAREAYETM